MYLSSLVIFSTLILNHGLARLILRRAKYLLL